MDAKRGWRSKLKYLPLAVPVLGLLELGAHSFFSRRAPAASAWADLSPLVRSWYQPGDLVVVAPFWAEPMARWSFGDALMPMRDVSRPDATRYARAIEVSTLGRRSTELLGWKIERETKHGAFVVRALSNPAPQAITYDFVDHLVGGTAVVRVEKGGTHSDCSFTSTAPVEGGGLGGPPIYPASRFVCSGEPPYVFAGVTVIDDEQNRPRRCIWAHPPAGDAELAVRFHDVPLGDRLHGHAGMGWLIERDLAVPRFTIRVLVGTTEAGRVVHEPGDFWKAFELPLGAAARSTADVEFRVSAPPTGTHVCFEADSR